MIEPYRLSINNLSFRYASEENYVLENFSCELLPGKKIAIVGESGVGKSTLINILMGFYYDYEGEITINQTNFREISKQEKRTLFSYVGSDLYLFETTLQQNFQLAKESLDEEGMLSHLEMVNMHQHEQINKDLNTRMSEF